MSAKSIVRASIALWGLAGLGGPLAPAQRVQAGCAGAGPPRPATKAEISDMITAAGPASDFGNAAVVYVLDEADVYVEKSGLATTESCQILKILTDAGVKSNSVYRRQFDPSTNNVTVKSIRIHRANGNVEDIDVSEILTQPATQGIIFWGHQQYVLSLPRLDVGDAVQTRVSRTGYNIAYLADTGAGNSDTVLSALGEPLRPPMPGQWYEVMHFQSDYPIVKKRYSVHMPSDMPVQYEVYNGELKSSLWFDGDRQVYTWTAEDIPAIKREPNMVATSDCVAKVVLATVPSWEAKSRWFFEANESQFEATEAIRAKVAELTDGLDDDEAKIAALTSWVADNCRYVGTTPGQHEGFTLHKGIETFRDRGAGEAGSTPLRGCKDKAGMLVTMLRTLGYDAYAALTMAGRLSRLAPLRGRVEDISADQFNHSVTAIRNQDGSFRLLDMTPAKPVRRASPAPYFGPEENLVTCRSRGEITTGGALRIGMHMGMKGYPCTVLRRTLAARKTSEREDFIRQSLRIAPNVQIEQSTYTDPYDYSRDSRLDVMLVAREYTAGRGRTRVFRPPLLTHPLSGFLFPDAFYAIDADERQFGMKLRATRLVRYKETLKLPRGWSITHLPEPIALDSPAALLTFEALAGDGMLTYEFELALKKRLVPPEDYPEFKKVLDSVRKLSEEWFVCTVDELGSEQAALPKQGDK